METLNDIRQQLARRRARRSTLEVPMDSLRLNDNAKLVVEGRCLALGTEARSTLARQASIPSTFFDACPEEVQAYLFNRLFPRAIQCKDVPEHVGLILEDETLIVGVADPTLTLFSGDEVLDAALAAKPDDVDEDELEVACFGLNGDLRVSIVSRQLETHARVNDIVRAGLDIRHSDTGAVATQIESYLLRLACSNGMLIKVCTHTGRGHSRIRRAAAHNVQLTRHRIEEKARTAWGELHAKMAVVKLLATEHVDNAAALIRSIGEKLRFPERLVNNLVEALAADEMEPSGTLWDIVSAFSRVGTHTDRLSLITRRYLQEVSGDLIGERVERCPTCGRICRGRMQYLPRR